MSRFRDQNSAPSLYNALQSLSKISSALTKSALRSEVSPSRKKSISPRQPFQLDEGSLSSIIEETERCGRILTDMINNPTKQTESIFKSSTPMKTKREVENKERLLLQVVERLIGSGYSSPRTTTQAHQSPNLKGNSSRTESLLSKITSLREDNEQLKEKLLKAEKVLVQREMGSMNEEMRAMIESEESSLVKEVAQLRMEKSIMNAEFQKEVMRYNEVFRKLKSQASTQGGESDTLRVRQLVEENERLLTQKEKDRETIEELGSKLKEKHHHLRDLRRNMSKLYFES